MVNIRMAAAFAALLLAGPAAALSAAAADAGATGGMGEIAAPAAPEVVDADFSDARKSPTIAYYTFEEGVPGDPLIAVYDWSGNGRNGSVRLGAPSYSNNVDGQIEDNQVSSSWGIPDSADFMYPFPFQNRAYATLEFYIYPDPVKAGGSSDNIFWGNLDARDTNRFQIGICCDDYLFLNYRDPDGNMHYLPWTYQYGIKVPPGIWSYIAIVKRQNNYRIFVCNRFSAYRTKLAGEGDDTAPNLPNSPGWTINGRHLQDSSQFIGQLDQIRLTKGALKKSQFLVHHFGCD